MIDTAVAGSVSGVARQRVQAEGFVSAKPERHLNVDTPVAYQPSVIDQLYQQGSARIRFPDMAASGPLQAVLLNTAGGLTGDDEIRWTGAAGEQSHLCLSTAACEKIYRSHGPDARQATRLEVASGARLEWLPQESILFNGACLNRTMHVQLAEQSEALLVESLVFGRQAMNESIARLRVRDQWRIHRGGKLLHAEALQIDFNDQLDARKMCMLHHFSAISTILFVGNGNDEQLISVADRIRSIAGSDPDEVRFGASVLPSRLVVRVLATDSYQLRKFLIPCLELLNNGRAVPAVWKV